MVTDRQALTDAGGNVAEAARTLGVSRSTLSRRLDREGLSHLKTSPRAQDGDQLRSDPSESFTEIPVVIRDYTHLPSLRVYPLGDVHLGSPAHAADRWREWIGYLAEKPATSMIGTGDFLNSALKDSKSESYDEELTVGEAMKTLRAQLEPLADRIDVLIPGNHEARIYRAVGLDPIEVIADALGIPYARAGVLLVYRVGCVEYEVYVRHGTGNAGGQIGSRANQLARGAHVVAADVHVSGHTHSQVIATDDQFVRDGDRMCRRRRIYLSSGSFVGYEQYAMERGFVAGRIGSPRIYLDGARHDMHVSV